MLKNLTLIPANIHKTQFHQKLLLYFLYCFIKAMCETAKKQVNYTANLAG